MEQTFFEKWKHRLRNTWLVLTGRAWVGHGNPMHWQYIGPEDGGFTADDIAELRDHHGQ